MKNLKNCLLAKPFTEQTAESFYDHVLRQRIQPPAKKIKLPKIVMLHKLDATTKKCLLCGKKPRSEKSTCKGEMPAAKTKSA